MTRLPTLTTALLDLLRELEDVDLPLIIGGGFGVYLRHQQIAKDGRQTMLPELPEPRSTSDLDLFLRAELLLDSDRLKPLRDALVQLGYEVVKGAEHYQFVRPGPPGEEERAIKIDVLTGPTAPFKGTRVKFDARRVKPDPSVKLHAHPCEEALTLAEGASQVELLGRLSDGTEYRGTVLLPHAFTFLTMKLFALRDQIHDTGKDHGRHHALDLYAVVGSMSATEWDECLEMSGDNRDEAVAVECGRIVASLFGAMDSLGTLRLRESAYYRPGFDTGAFLAALRELFID